MGCMYALRMNPLSQKEYKNILKGIARHERPTFLDIEPLVMVKNTAIDNELKINDLFVYPARMVIGSIKNSRTPSLSKMYRSSLGTNYW